MKFIRNGKVFDTNCSDLLGSTTSYLGWLEGPVCFEQTQFFRSHDGVCFSVHHQFKYKGFFNYRPSKEHYVPSSLSHVYDNEMQCAEAMNRENIAVEAIEMKIKLQVACQ